MGNSVSHFTDLTVWRRSHSLFLELLKDVEGMPQRRAVIILTDQSLRSVGSISANIAEGFNRSKKKYLSCLDIARGEATEAENWLYKFRDTGYMNREIAMERLREILEIQKMLAGLIRSIRHSPDRTRN